MVDRSNTRNAARQNSNMMPPVGNNNNHTGQDSCLGNGCSNNRNGNCKALLHRLQALDFSIIDTILYLNAYPESAEALAYYHKLISERDALKTSLGHHCNMPVTGFENASAQSWDWVEGPWPWEASAN